MATTPPKTNTSAIRGVTSDLDNHTIVLRQLKEAVEVAQRLRGDPADSFVRVSELAATGTVRQVNQVIQPPSTGGGGAYSGGPQSSVGQGYALLASPNAFTGANTFDSTTTFNGDVAVNSDNPLTITQQADDAGSLLNISASNGSPYHLKFQRSDFGAGYDIRFWNNAGNLLISPELGDAWTEFQCGAGSTQLGIAAGASIFTTDTRGLLAVNGSTDALIDFQVGGSTSAYIYGGSGELRFATYSHTNMTWYLESKESMTLTPGVLTVIDSTNSGCLCLGSDGQGYLERFNNVGYALHGVDGTSFLYFGSEASGYVQDNVSGSYLTYGSLFVGGTKGGYQGIAVYDDWAYPTLMSNGASAAGVYMQEPGFWAFYWDGSTFQFDPNGKGASFGGGISASGNIAAFSDARLKTNLQPLTPSLDWFDSIHGYSYYRTDRDPDTQRVGFIAQEWRAVQPQVVGEDTNGTLSLDYGNTVAVLWELVRQLRDRVYALEAAPNA